MRLYYCPECKKEEIKNGLPPRNEITFTNIRDGYGRPITHYKCECGNYLAGSIDITGLEIDENGIAYYKEVIAAYNKGGHYYTDGLYEKIEERFINK